MTILFCLLFTLKEYILLQVNFAGFAAIRPHRHSQLQNLEGEEEPHYVIMSSLSLCHHYVISSFGKQT